MKTWNFVLLKDIPYFISGDGETAVSTEICSKTIIYMLLKTETFYTPQGTNVLLKDKSDHSEQHCIDFQ